MTSVSRGFGQTAKCVHHVFPANCSRIFQSLPDSQLGQRRSAGDRGDAAFGQEFHFAEMPINQFRGQLENVSAGRIFNLCRRVRRGHDAGIARVFEVV